MICVTLGTVMSARYSSVATMECTQSRDHSCIDTTALRNMNIMFISLLRALQTFRPKISEPRFLTSSTPSTPFHLSSDCSTASHSVSASCLFP